MVRKYWQLSFAAVLLGSSFAWGQQAAPLATPPAKTEQIITVKEGDKPAQKCRVLRTYTLPDGNQAMDVEDIVTGEKLTIVTGSEVSAPASSYAPQRVTRTSRLFHWKDKSDFTPETTTACANCGSNCATCGTASSSSGRLVASPQGSEWIEPSGTPVMERPVGTETVGPRSRWHLGLGLRNRPQETVSPVMPPREEIIDVTPPSVVTQGSEPSSTPGTLVPKTERRPGLWSKFKQGTKVTQTPAGTAQVPPTVTVVQPGQTPTVVTQTPAVQEAPKKRFPWSHPKPVPQPVVAHTPPAQQTPAPATGQPQTAELRPWFTSKPELPKPVVSAPATPPATAQATPPAAAPATPPVTTAKTAEPTKSRLRKWLTHDKTAPATAAKPKDAAKPDFPNTAKVDIAPPPPTDWRKSWGDMKSTQDNAKASPPEGTPGAPTTGWTGAPPRPAQVPGTTVTQLPDQDPKKADAAKKSWGWGKDKSKPDSEKVVDKTDTAPKRSWLFGSKQEKKKTDGDDDGKVRASTRPAKVKPSVPTELPQAEKTKTESDPLMNPGHYSKHAAEIEDKTAKADDAKRDDAKGDKKSHLKDLLSSKERKPGTVSETKQADPRAAGVATTNNRMPLGAQSVLAANGGQPGPICYLPVPMVTLPQRGPAPGAQVPMPPMVAMQRYGPPPMVYQPVPYQAPGDKQAGNAFSEPAAPAPKEAASAKTAAAGNAFSEPAPLQSGMVTYPMTMAPRYPMPMMQARPWPQGPMPAGPYQMGYPVASAGYPNPYAMQPRYPQGYPVMQQQPMQQPVMPVAYQPAPMAAGTPGSNWQSPQQMIATLRGALYASQREWAAMSLASVDVRQVPQAVDALVAAARNDGAATVRAACVQSLARMNVGAPVLQPVLEALKDDADPRVRMEVEQTAARWGVSQTSKVIEPASAVQK